MSRYLSDNRSNTQHFRQYSNPRPQQINLALCLYLSKGEDKRLIPASFLTYYINSKRRFFLYFKTRRDMERAIEIFETNKVKYHRRQSLFPDREEYEQILFHCNYKYKRIDLRKRLKSTTRYRDPVDVFDQHTQNQLKQHQVYTPSDRKEEEKLPQGQKINPETQNKVDIPITIPVEQQSVTPTPNPQQSTVQKALELSTQKMQISKKITFLADYGSIKVRTQQVYDILQNPGLIKRLFKAQQVA